MAESPPLGPCFLALGGNIGDRFRFLSKGLCRVCSLEGVKLRRTSSLFSTSPQYVTDQPPFLNAVAELELSAARLGDIQGLLDDLKTIEEEVGRVKGGQRRGPRVLDLDIVAVGESQIDISTGKHPLKIPHDGMHERDFVLVPMAQLCPDWRHPGLEGRPTLTDLVARLRAGAANGVPAGASLDSWPQQLIPVSGGLSGRGLGLLRARGEATLIMGILNATPDSFSDGGDHLKVEDAVAAARAMHEGGAHIIDVGGESTRPGAAEVHVEEEINRVVPVIRAIRDAGLEVTISVDTRKAAVASAAVEAGADWINDVSGGEFDSNMLSTAAKTMAPIVLMHMKGTPETMKSLATYSSLLADVENHLRKRRAAAEAAGVPSWNIIIDPGVGFAKTMDHNLLLLRQCGDMVKHLAPTPVLLSASRKRFLGTILDEPDAKRRVFGNAATTAAAVAGHVDIIRVHDVREMAQTALVSDRIFRQHRPS